MKYPAPMVRALPLRERPLYRVQHDASACNLVEILAAIVGGSRQIEIAHSLLAEFENLTGLMFFNESCVSDENRKAVYEGIQRFP